MINFITSTARGMLTCFVSLTFLLPTISLAENLPPEADKEIQIAMCPDVVAAFRECNLLLEAYKTETYSLRQIARGQNELIQSFELQNKELVNELVAIKTDNRSIWRNPWATFALGLAAGGLAVVLAK